MAIQLRRGVYANFDPTKMVPGEIAVVQSGDTGTESGKSVYMAFNTGDVERLATHEEMEAELESLLVNRVYFGTCSTSAGTAEKVVVCDGFVLENNALIYISFSQANTVTSNVKLNVNNTGAKTAYFRNSSSTFTANAAMVFRYNSNGSRFELMQDKYVYTLDGLRLDGNGASAISHYGTCSTAGSTKTKTVSNSAYVTPSAGSFIIVKFSETNTHLTPTLKVNTSQERGIRFNGALLEDPEVLQANGTYLFVFDGTYWELIGGMGGSRAELDENGIIHF